MFSDRYNRNHRNRLNTINRAMELLNLLADEMEPERFMLVKQSLDKAKDQLNLSVQWRQWSVNKLGDPPKQMSVYDWRMFAEEWQDALQIVNKMVEEEEHAQKTTASD